jgi:hypothetical protein
MMQVLVQPQPTSCGQVPATSMFGARNVRIETVPDARLMEL